MEGKYALAIVGMLLVVAVAGMIKISDETTGLMTATGQARCKAPFPHTYERGYAESLPNWQDYCVYATGYNGDIMDRWMCCNERLGKERRPPAPQVKPMTGYGDYY